ncbi:MAG TPA: MOSC N-terminal beta barrel domain-containing protein [Anaeromyxobacter sp.]
MHVAELWRYPVKSMAGEKLAQARLGPGGVEGDRLVLARGRDGRVVTARVRPRLLGHRAVLGPDGEPLVDGRPWRAPEVARDVEAAAGAGVRLEPSDEERFDVLPLLVATDGAVASLGYDRRRFRPNILVGGVEGLAERAWPGRTLRVGEAVIRAQKLRARCVMTTFDPDTQAQDPEVLRRIVRELEGTLALDCFVVEPGLVRVGDPVALAG